jgi:hypothetical protein
MHLWRKPRLKRTSTAALAVVESVTKLAGNSKRIAMLAVIACALALGLWFATGSRGSGATSLGPRFGVSLDLPNGWIGRIYDGNRGTAPVMADLQAGSFAAGDSLELLKDKSSDTWVTAAEAMGPDDILVLLWETAGSGGFDYQPLAGSPHIAASDLGSAFEGFPSDHAVGRQFFATGGRMFDLMVEFGRLSPDREQLDRANEVLTTLRIEPQS